MVNVIYYSYYSLFSFSIKNNKQTIRNKHFFLTLQLSHSYRKATIYLLRLLKIFAKHVYTQFSETAYFCKRHNNSFLQRSSLGNKLIPLVAHIYISYLLQHEFISNFNLLFCGHDLICCCILFAFAYED